MRRSRLRLWRWTINRHFNRAFAIRNAAASAALLALLVIAGCRQDMQDQPKFIPQRGTDFYADGRSARPQVEGTVARGQLHADAYFYTGVMNGKEQDALPFPATLAVLQRGEERFNIYCAPCHSRVGNGDGMIVQRGYKPAANLHDPQHVAQPLSHYYIVMSNGFGAMPDYAAQLTPEDRWAVAAYIRALQLSQNAKPADAPAGIHTDHLANIATEQGYPADFADPWSMTGAAVNRVASVGIYGNVVGNSMPAPSPQVENILNLPHNRIADGEQRSGVAAQPDRANEQQTQWAPLKP
jgi:mono/diheme cytochrome c family protein